MPGFVLGTEAMRIFQEMVRRARGEPRNRRSSRASRKRALELGGTAFSGARVTHDVNQVIDPGTSTSLNFNTEIFDVTDYHDTVTNNQRLTAPSDGYYLIGVSLRWDTAFSATKVGNTSIVINGSSYIAGHAAGAGEQNNREIELVTLTHLNSGDYATVTVENTDTLDHSVATGTTTPIFWITKVG